MPGFEPKQKVDLDPPKDDPITLEHLSKCDGMSDAIRAEVQILDPIRPILKHSQARTPTTRHTLLSRLVVCEFQPETGKFDGEQGTVFDVSGNKAYGPEGSYKGILPHHHMARL